VIYVHVRNDGNIPPAPKGGNDMTHQLHINQTVRNLGIIAKVAGFHETTGDPILRPLYNDGTRWLADAAKCEPIEDEPQAAWRHTDGLVSLGQIGR
jgi:hypothetical protein